MKKQLFRQVSISFRQFSPMYKPEVIRINISATFLARARCKECKSGPDYYYAVQKPYMWANMRSNQIFSAIIRKWIKRLVTDWYKDFQPRHFHDMGDFSFELPDKSYRPTLYRARGANIKERENVVEFLGCNCGATVWAFNDKSVKNRPEITNRKGRYKYPQKFVH